MESPTVRARCAIQAVMGVSSDRATRVSTGAPIMLQRFPRLHRTFLVISPTYNALSPGLRAVGERLTLAPGGSHSGLRERVLRSATHGRRVSKQPEVVRT